MDNTREKLIELFFSYQKQYNSLVVSKDGLADHLIANGVTIPVRCKECRYYNQKDLECTIKFDSDGERLGMSPNYYCADGKKVKVKE